MSSKELRSYARSRVFTTLEERAEKGGFDRDLWRALADLGLTGMIIDKDLGGGGAGVKEFSESLAILAAESLDLGLTLSLLDHVMLCAYPIKVFGSRALKDRYLPSLCRGELIGAAAVSEPDTGSNPSRMRTMAKEEKGGYLINGVKEPVTNAPVADVFVVIAATDPEAGKEGLSAFILDRREGVAVEDIPLDYLSTSPHGRLAMKDVWVPDDHLVGERGAGHERISRSMFIWERSVLLPVIVAFMERYHHMVVSRLDPSNMSPDMRMMLAQRKVETTAYKVIADRLLDLTFGEEENGRERMELLLFFGKALPSWVESMREVVENTGVPEDVTSAIMLRDLRLVEVGSSILDWQFQKLLF